MTCVGYDEQFVRVLARNADAYVSPAPQSEVDRGPKKAKAADGKRSGAQRKRKAADVETGLEHEDGASAQIEERRGKMHRAN